MEKFHLVVVEKDESEKRDTLINLLFEVQVFSAEQGSSAKKSTIFLQAFFQYEYSQQRSEVGGAEKQ